MKVWNRDSSSGSGECCLPPSIVTTRLPNCVNNFCHRSPINLGYCQFLMQNAKFIFPLYSGAWRGWSPRLLAQGFLACHWPISCNLYSLLDDLIEGLQQVNWTGDWRLNRHRGSWLLKSASHNWIRFDFNPVNSNLQIDFYTPVEKKKFNGEAPPSALHWSCVFMDGMRLMMVVVWVWHGDVL